MRIAEKEAPPETRATASKAVREGDRLVASISHQVIINGDESWVKFEANVAVGEDESPEDARQRVIEYVNEGVMEAVKTTVNTVGSKNEEAA